MSCNSRKSKNNPYSKDDLIKLALQNGMSKSKAQKSSKVDLCNFLNIDNKNKSIKSSSPKVSSFNRPCGMRKSKNFSNAFSKPELIELLIEKGLISKSFGYKTKIEELCKYLPQIPDSFIKEIISKPEKIKESIHIENKRVLPKFLLDMLMKKKDKKKIAISYEKVKSSKLYKPKSFEASIHKLLKKNIDKPDINIVGPKIIKRPFRSPPSKPNINKEKRVLDLSPLHKIEGPSSIFFLQPSDKIIKLLNRIPPSLLMMGDIHVGSNKCKECTEKEGCFSLYESQTLLKYLNKEARDKDIKMDLFLETWEGSQRLETDYEKVIPSGFNYTSALVDTISKNSNCFANRSRKGTKCILDSIRVHMGDTRLTKITKDNDELTNIDKKYTGDLLITIFLFYVYKRNIKGFEKYVQIAYPKYTVKYIYKLIERYFDSNISDLTIQQEYFKEPFYIDYSRTLRQFQQLPETIRKDIVREYSHTLKYNDERKKSLIDVIKNSGVLFNINIIKDKPNSLDYEVVDLASKLVMAGFTPISMYNVDLYIIARILKYKEDISDLSIVYLGDLHIENIIEILVTNGWYEIKNSFGNVGINSPYSIFKHIKNDYNLTTKEKRNKLNEYISNVQKCIPVNFKDSLEEKIEPIYINSTQTFDIYEDD